MTIPTCKKRYIIQWLICVFLCSPGFAAEPIKYRILIQVSENSINRMLVALNSAYHTQLEFGPHNIAISIIALAGGVQTLRSNAPRPIPELIRQANALGIDIIADQQAMLKAKLTPVDMLTEVRYVTSGWVEIIEKQQQGWHYIHP